MKTVVVDICGTLYRSNTTFDFLYWKFKGNWKYVLFYHIYHNIIWKVLNRICSNCFGLDLNRKIGIWFLKGYKRDVLVKEVEKFYETYLSVRKNDQVFLQLDKLKNIKGVELFLASATIDVIGEVISQRVGIPLYLSTELKYLNNICVGAIHKDALGTKIQYLSKLTPIWKCYTDDISDLPLVKNACKPIIIVYPRTKKRWEKVFSSNGLQPELIYIDKD